MHRLALALVLVAPACASAPRATPSELGTEILGSIQSGRVEQADVLMTDVIEFEDYRERIYPKLFEAARTCHEQGDSFGACEILRFMNRYYTASPQVREALLLSLFMERSKQEEPDPGLLEELNVTLKGLELRSPVLPFWVKLIDAQIQIDLGFLDEARKAFDAFIATWDGVTLGAYAEEIKRYLGSHGVDAQRATAPAMAPVRRR